MKQTDPSPEVGLPATRAREYKISGRMRAFLSPNPPPSLPPSLFFVGPHEPSTLPLSIPHPTQALRKGTMIAWGALQIIRSLLDELRSLIV